MFDLGTLGKMVKLTTLFGKCFTTYCTIVSIDCASEDTGLPGAKWTGNDWEASKKQIMFQYVFALYQASSSPIQPISSRYTLIYTYIYVVYSLKGAGFFHLNEIVQYYQLYIQYNLSRNFGDSIRIQLAHILQALPSYNSSHSQFNPRTKTYRMSQKKMQTILLLLL